MEKNLDQWREIAELINKDKQRALADFHRQTFVPGRLPERRPAPRSGLRLFLRPGLMAAAASLLLAAGLISFWLLRGSWRKAPAAPEWDQILAGTFLYGGGDRLEAGNIKAGSAAPSAPYFTAWAAAALERPAAVAEPVDPSATVERGDPGEVRRKISRVIREKALERLLTQFREIHNKEA